MDATTTDSPAQTVERCGWSPADWSTAAGISRSSTYELIAAGSIESVRFGQRRIITTSPRDWLRSLSEAA